MPRTAKQVQWAKDNRDRIKASQVKWNERNAEKVKLYNFRDRYKLTLDEARIVLASKPDSCETCGREEDICYDHSHASGEHRGWLCRRCNSVLGYVDDDPAVLRAMADYLERAI